MKYKLIFIFLLSLFALNTFAQVSLDTGFSGDGKVMTAISSGNDQGSAIVVQPDGKILVAGTIATTGVYDNIAVVRYNTDGSLDNTFGTGGVAIINTTTNREEVYAMALQSDGKILLSGMSDYDFLVVRLNSDGSPDTGFGVTGSGYSVFALRVNDYANSITVQSDGKIVVAGYGTAVSSPDAYMIVLRLTSSGGFDKDFSGDGRYDLHITGAGTYGRAVAIDNNNKIVVAGEVYKGSLGSDFAVARFTSSGILDNTFNSVGSVYTDIGTNTNDQGFAVVVDANNNVFVAGNSGADYALVKYTNSGVLDNTFGTGGKVVTNISGNDYARGMAIQPDGKIIVAGQSNSDFSMARYLSNGTLDPTFGSGGKVTTAIGSGNDFAFGIDIDENGGIYLGGYAHNGSNYDYAVAKYSYNLKPDVPVISSPSNNAVKQNTTTSLVWGTAAGATSYNLQVSTNSNFSSTVINETGLTSTTYSASGLTAGQTYYWKVSSTNSHGTSNWTSTYLFKVQLPTPVVSSPADGATDLNSNNAVITWGAIALANSYSYKVSTSDTFDPLILNVSGYGTNSVTLTTLASNTTYYYQIKADDAAGTNSSEWSATRSFTTSLVPVVPTLSSPSDDVMGQSTGLTLSWSASPDAASYGVQVSTQSDFSSTVVNQTGIATTSYDVSVLNNGQKYYWRVNATNASGTSDWSSAFAFTVKLGTPVLVTPAHEATGVGASSTLQWDDVSSADSYYLKVSTHSDLSSPIINESYITSSEYALSGLSNFTTYYWSVRANDNAYSNLSDWSATRSFTTGGPTQIASGNVSGTWAVGDSPFEVNGDITIPNGETLTIEAGVEVRFKGSYKFNVQGRLLAEGTQSDSIKFTATNTTTGWQGFVFSNTPSTNDTSFIKYSIILYGKNNSSTMSGKGLMVINFSKLKISNCRFSYCDGGNSGSGNVAYIGSADISITNSIFDSNLNSATGYDNIDIYFNSSSSVLTGNTFRNNPNGYAIKIQSNYTTDTMLISDNTITNYRYGIYTRYSKLYTKIVNNTIQNCTNFGIFIDNSQQSSPVGNFIISNNTIKNISYFAMQIERNAVIKFDSNFVTNCQNAIYLNGNSTASLGNNIITNCGSSSSSYILLVDQCSALLTNNTIAYNEGPAVKYQCSGDMQATLKNNIMWGNTGTDINITDGYGYNNPVMTYSLTTDSYAWQTNCIHSDPQFVSTPSGTGKNYDGTTADYNLQSGSPAIDAGDPSYTSPHGGEPMIDMGAKEYICSTPMTHEGMDDSFDGNYSPGQSCAVAANTGTTVNVTVQVYLGDPPNAQGKHIGKYWDISATGDAKIRLYYTAAAKAAFTGAPTIFHYTGGNWVAVPTSAEQTDGASFYVESLIPLSSWSSFTVGDANDAMPVEMISFEAKVKESTVILNWGTATEINNYGFEVQRSVIIDQQSVDSQKLNADNWVKVGFVNGAANSNSPKNYSFKDNPEGGTEFAYRIKQIDMDGQYKLYDAITVKLGKLAKAVLMQNNPNPFNPSTAIKFYIPKSSDISIKIYDILGREVVTLLNEQKDEGYHIIYWNGRDGMGKSVASGVYLYRLTAGDFTETKKMLMMK